MAETRSPYPEGSIVRIHCENFLTYKSVTINPGPRLNIVVGPNGTGKSSIVCAIAIGLCASPKLLGRSDHIEEFIMMGTEEGYVEIELYKRDGENPIIRRTLRKVQPKSVFTLNGKKATESLIKPVIEKGGAQLSNLCTFLPQEKVGEFSGFNATQLLLEAEKAINEDILYKKHQELIQEEGQLGDIERQLIAKKAQLESLCKQNEKLEDDRKKMEERQEHALKADLCSKKLYWIEFDELQTEAIKLKTQKEDTQRELEELKKRFEPLKEKVHKAENEEKKLRKKMLEWKTIADTATKKHIALLSKSASEFESVSDIQSQVSNLSANKDAVKKKLDIAKRELEAKQEALANFDSEAIKQQYNNMKAEYTAANAEYSRAEDEANSAEQKAKKERGSVESAERKLASLTGNREQVNAIKSARGQDSLNLRQLVDLPANRGRFKRTVHGPIALDVVVNRPEFLDVLDDKIPYTVKMGFVTECSEDYRLLMEIAKPGNLKVTIYNIEGGQLKSRRPNQAQGLIDQGVVTCLEDTITCPPAVQQVLRDHAKLDMSVVGHEAFSDMFKRDSNSVIKQLLGQAKSFSAYAGSNGTFTKYSGSKSKYQSGEFSTSVAGVRPSSIMKIGEDPSIKVECERNIQIAKVALDKAAQVYDQLKKKASLIKRKRDAAFQKSEQCRGNLSQDKKLKSEISSAQKKYATAQANFEAVNVEKETKTLINKMSISMRKRLDYLEQAQVEAETMMNADLARGALALGLEMAIDLLACRERDLRKEEGDLHEKEDKLAAIKQSFQTCKDKLKKARDKADEHAPIFEKDASGNKVPLPLKELLDELPMDRARITAEKEAAELAMSMIHDNREVVRMYNERKIQIAQIETEVAALENQGQSPREAFDQKKKGWVTKLKEHCKDLNKMFSSYMQELGNEGRVEIEESTESLSKWGLILSVSFRQGSAPVPLKKNVQSGGERSVSTIMFLMALQDMVKSPFRVVDEINQGMDERNERIVFRRIVERSVGPGRPQYFLITPKLLQGLTAMDHEDVTVLFVFNGPFNLPRPESWNLSSFFGNIDTSSSSAIEPTTAKRRKVA